MSFLPIPISSRYGCYVVLQERLKNATLSQYKSKRCTFLLAKNRGILHVLNPARDQYVRRSKRALSSTRISISFLAASFCNRLPNCSGNNSIVVTRMRRSSVFGVGLPLPLPLAAVC